MSAIRCWSFRLQSRKEIALQLPPFKVDTIWEKDKEIVLRDGIKTRADVFRPQEGGAVPALIAWSPYGKSCLSTRR